MLGDQDLNGVIGAGTRALAINRDVINARERLNPFIRQPIDRH